MATPLDTRLKRLARTPISLRQEEVLRLMLSLFGEDMDATGENYRAIAERIGWKTYGAVSDCLFALRAKGAVRSIGGTQTRPDRWQVVEKPGGSEYGRRRG